MEGIPNTPRDAPGGAAESPIICPTCGTAVSASARFCGSCGQALTPAPASQPQAQPSPAPTAQAAPNAGEASAGVVGAAGAAAPEEAPRPAQPAPPPGGGRLCNWCRNYSPAEARVCESCGAVFPTPEGDAALEKAARERIDNMQADIARTKTLTWWPFRGR